MRTSVKTGKRASVKVNAADIDKLAASFRGKIIRPSDPDYDQARTIWNAMIDRKPALIAQCAGVSDVQAAVNFARTHDMLVSIKGGGHNIAGNAVCDNGIMIDFSRMRQVRVDPNTRVAQVEPGATLGDMDRETQMHGLATPLGINSTTGVAGLTLGGGFGWLTRQYGMTVDNLLAVDVVTADGKFLTASENENADLFWAVRGGGGNFGVITRFEFRLHKVGPNVLAGLVVYAIKDAPQVLKAYREYVETLPVESNVWIVMRLAPPLPFLPAEVHGTPIVALAVFHNGNPDEGRKNLERVRHFATPVGEMIDVMPYVNWQQMFDPLLGPGARNYWKSHNVNEISDDLINILVQSISTLPDPQSDIFFGYMKGAPGEKPEDYTAYANRDTGWAMNVHTRWTDPSKDEVCIKWARDLTRETAPFATGGVYINFLTEEETDRVRAAYGPGYERLLQAKRKYDPENLFCMNQNIDPKG